MRIAVFGAGAVGTWLGAALARTEHDVVLVARGAHGAALAGAGARLRGDDGTEERVSVVVADPAAVGPVDVVIAAVKAHDLAAAAPQLARLVGPDTIIVGAQNGVPWWYFHGVGGEHEGRVVHAVDPGGAVAAALPPAQALGVVVYVGAQVLEPGVVAVRPEAGLVLGEPDGSASPRLAAVAQALEAAGFPVRRTADIRTEVWTKLMGNASLNLLSVLTRAGTASLATDAGVGPLVRRMMDEVVAIAEAAGARPRISVDERLAITARLGDHRTSTLQDLQAGKRLELDALGAAVLELAGLFAVPAPTLSAVYALADLQARTLGLR
jgi:2-dehydropantoate 2-reductase